MKPEIKIIDTFSRSQWLFLIGVTAWLVLTVTVHEIIYQKHKAVGRETLKR